MQINIIKVGNSKGLRIPKTVLDEYQIDKTVELELKDGYIELRPTKKVRANWKNEFAKMKLDADEQDMIPDIFTDEDL